MGSSLAAMKCRCTLALLLPAAAAALQATAEEAARVTCALVWSGQNLTPLLAPKLLRAAPDEQLELDGLLGGSELKSFALELERFRSAKAEKGAGELPYASKQCYKGEGGAKFAESFDFAYNETGRDDHDLVESYILRLLPDVPAKAERSVLSIGCGDGRWVARYVEKALSEKDRVWLLDLHESNLQKAAGALEPRQAEAMQLDLNAEQLKLPREGLHLVESSLALHHVEKLQDVLAAIHDALVPGGLLVLMDIVEPTGEKAGMLRPSVGYVPVFHGVEFFRRPQEVRQEVARAGLELLEYTRPDPSSIVLAATKPLARPLGEL